MYEDEWRLNVKLRSKRLLNDYIKHLGWSGRRLAREAGLKPAIVGHLRKGERTTCLPSTAHAIEDALGCPRGLLFAETVSTVSRSNGHLPRAS